MYDLEYLQQLHYKEIMKSMRKEGYTTEYVAQTYVPGVLRPSLAVNEIRSKKRYVASKGIMTTVVYSRMEPEMLKALDGMLKSINVDELAKLSCEEFSGAMTNLYADLDFCHPFTDGNSRTLRAFIAEVANESGFYVDWDKYNQPRKTHEQLYAARDVEVNSIAVQCMDNIGPFKRLAEESINVLQQDFKSLAEIFDEITQPKNRIHEQSRDSGIEID